MTTFLGVDLGMGADKTWGAGGGVQVLSQVSTNGTAHLTENLMGGRGKRKPMELRSASGSFYVGDNAHDYGVPVENLDFDRLTGTPEIKSLFYAALTRYQTDVQSDTFDESLKVMVGLPYQMMVGRTSKEYTTAVRKWMVGLHEWTADGIYYKAEVESIQMRPQAMAAIFDFCYTDEAEVIPERAVYMVKETAAISIGFNTIEFMVTRDHDDIAKFTGGIKMGVRRLLEDIRRRYDNLYTLGELDMMLRMKRLDKAVLRQALEDYGMRVTGAIENQWSEYFNRFEAVLCVGGGAELLRPYLETKFRGKALVAADPVMSISRGLYKMAVKFQK